MKLHTYPLILFFLLISLPVKTAVKEFTHSDILSFEKGTDPVISGKDSHITLSEQHFKHGEKSLQWRWNHSGAIWKIKKNIPFRFVNPHGDNSVGTFVFWVYSPQVYWGGSLRFEFYKNNRLCSYFDYNLGFKGWSGAWVAFERDMIGTPEEDMDELRVTVSGVEQGELFFDHLMLMSYQDVRHHTADFQAPFINKETTSHWLVLLESWKKQNDLPLPGKITAETIQSLDTIEHRLESMTLANVKPTQLNRLERAYANYNIRYNPDGSVTGIPLFFERYGETYERIGAMRYNLLFGNAMGLSTFNRTMHAMAVTYRLAENEQEKEQIGRMYIDMMRYMLDQGFRAGSAMGTLHHLGYSMRLYYTTSFLMRDLLRENGLAEEVQQAMEWFAGTGEVKLAPEIMGMDVDAFNTTLVPRLASILMLDNSAEKQQYLQAFVRWVDNGFAYSDGTQGTFKVDGSMFHHRHNYPAYAVGGLEGAVNAVWLFHNTSFAIQSEGKQHLKDALLAMRFYSNLLTWPLSLSGRHPDGEGHIFPHHYARLALSGSPDETDAIDLELAAVYLRLIENKETEYSRLFIEAGIEAEKSPYGNRSFPYSSMSVQRRDDWLISAMGHSRYLWATESYVGENHYGRYLNHGNLQILSGGEPISNFGSGFRQEGWDWNHFPGTTAAVLPLSALKANIKNLDEDSGYEEMLLSDESFAGPISLAGKNGAYAMKLHEHDKYNGSLRARKSFFFFDNRVVALGSNIRSALPENEVHTTLYQVYQPAQKRNIIFHREPVTESPVHRVSVKKATELSDGMDNYFFVKNGSVHLKRAVQHSFHEETDEPTQNPFSLAYINHGVKATTDSYEYLVLVQPEKQELTKVRKSFLSKRKPLYTVLQQDSMAHVVHDVSSKTTAFVFFEAGSFFDKKGSLTVSLPALVMTEELGSQQLRIGVADPDLRFYEGDADEVFDERGQRIERSVYSRDWIDNSSKPSTVRLTISGEWALAEASDYFKIISSENGRTILDVACQHGLTRETVLKLR